MVIVIYLRDLSKPRCKMLAKARAATDTDKENVRRGDSPSVEAALADFTERAKKALPKAAGRPVDIDISVWGYVGTFTLPKELTRLIGEHGWPINFTVP